MSTRALLLTTLTLSAGCATTGLSATRGPVCADRTLDLPSLVADARRHVVMIKTDVAVGTGFIVQSGADALRIVTNHHVIANARAIQVDIPGHNGAPVTLAGVEVMTDDERRDLAVLRVNKLGDLDLGLRFAGAAPVLGESVVALGYPYVAGAEPTLTAERGEVTATERRFGDLDFIQTNANINPGNSGGPVVNACGDLIGVVVATSRSTERTGLVIPVAELEPVLQAQAAAPDAKVRQQLDVLMAALGAREADRVGGLLADGVVTALGRGLHEAIGRANTKVQDIANILQRRGISMQTLGAAQLEAVLSGELDATEMEALRIAQMIKAGKLTADDALRLHAGLAVCAVVGPVSRHEVRRVQVAQDGALVDLMIDGDRRYAAHLVVERGAWRLDAIKASR